MAYNVELSLRIKRILIQKNIDFVEKKMFGGLAFMLNDKMCFGIIKDELMLRVLEHHYENLLERNHVREMDFTGKSIKGMIYIEEESLNNEIDLVNWLDFGIEFSVKGIVKSKKK